MSWHLNSELPGCQLGLSWVSEATDLGRDMEGGLGKAFGWERGRRVCAGLAVRCPSFCTRGTLMTRGSRLTLVLVIASRSLTLSAFSRTRCMHQPIESSSV